MRTILICVAVVAGAVMMASPQAPAPQAPDPNSQYRRGPDSMPHDGVPRGEIQGPFTLPSKVYPGTQHTYWVYVPAQYDPAVPASLMVFNDGQAFKDPTGDLHAPDVLDNLIYRREIPVMLCVLINPGRTPEQPEPTLAEWGDRTTNRPAEYNTPDDKYARVIVDELMPELYRKYNISKDPEQHGIGGSSSGAIAAFMVAWERPNDFRKVLSNVGSFVNIRGGDIYPERVLASEKKPIRIFLCDGRNDSRGQGRGGYDQRMDWFYQNVRLMKALTEKGYDLNYSWGMNLHGQKFGGAILPDMMRWLWRDGAVSTDPNDMVERGFREPARKTGAPAATARPPRPATPTRDPHTAGYVTATELPDGANPPANADGNFIIGPTHSPAPEMTAKDGVPKGAIYTFTMVSAESKIYPGIALEPNTRGAPDPDDPAKVIVTTSHPAPWTRSVTVYVPRQYVPGTVAPFMVGADGPDPLLFTALDNLIAAHKVPVMIAISIANGGGGDGPGSERGLEYDTMSGRYAEFVEREVLPQVQRQLNVKLTKDPERRAAMGGSSGGSCALIMAWYHPELYHRVLTYSGTYVNQQWPANPQTPHGAWEFHEHLIPNSPVKPIRLWMEVSDRDNFSPNSPLDNWHDWVVANENMAKALAAKGYHYQFVFARNAGHTDGAVKRQTLPEALEYLWF
jgi:enterochelin esterase family protein